MEFGKVTEAELGNIDFTLPLNNPQNGKVLSGKKAATKVYLGCAKWGRPDWIGQLYPKGTKATDFLAHYVKHFNSIELNATFHQPHSQEVIEKWAALAGKGFKFCPKMYQGISHWKRLKDAHVETADFLARIQAFGDKLGPVFLQMHDNFGLKSLDVLAQYLIDWPKDVSLFLELRNPAWFIESAEMDSFYALMQKQKIGLVITDAAGRRDVVHGRLTCPAAFVRYVGNDLHPTDFKRIDSWAVQLKEWMDAGLREMYFFIHNHEEARSPILAKYAVEKFNAVCGLKLDAPQLIGDKQISLF